MDEFIEVKIDVFEHIAQRARLRKNLTAAALVDEILKEFDDVSADAPGKYALYLKGSARPLNAILTLEQLDIQPQDELVFNYVKQANRQMLDPKSYAFLRDDEAGRVYDIQWQPAIIGRPTNEADHNINLAVNLQLHPKGQTVSRKHAQITFSSGRFILEALARQNPVFVNGKEISLGTYKEIKNGDRIQIGHHNLLLTFMTQGQVAAVSHEVRSQPIAQTPVSIPGPQSQKASEPVFRQAANPVVDEGKTYVAPTAVTSARLVVEAAKDMSKVGNLIELVNFPCVLGRDLPQLTGETEVSRRHAEINFSPATKKYYLADLKSTNGVSLQGAPIEPNRPYEVISGMRIGLGPIVLLRFEA